MKRRAMISQPMRNIPEKEIVATRERAKKYLESQGYEFVNTKFTDEFYNSEVMEKEGVVYIPLRFLAKSLDNMSKCNTVFFCEGWEGARGCRHEHAIATEYGVEILYESDVKNEM